MKTEWKPHFIKKDQSTCPNRLWYRKSQWLTIRPLPCHRGLY